ncbi:MAG: hypothetical protein GY799_20920 [Desulfobulbaceae bacterium]|nr:hypothetical protein [Desulfobulbaceae bacterium]
MADTEADGLLDTATGFHCLVFKPLNIDKFLVFCDFAALSEEHIKWFKDDFKAEFFPMNDYVDFLNSPETKGMICHNMFGFDLKAMKMWNDITYTNKTLNGKPFFHCDTLVLSRGLNPERRLPKGCPGSVKNTETGKMDKIGPHGLEAWGYKVGVAKPTVHDWTSQPLEVYVHRCIEDVKINELVYHYLIDSMSRPAIAMGKRKGDWKLPMRMQSEVYRLMCGQEDTGVLFDQEAAKKLVVEVDVEMGSIEGEVEPSLGERTLPGNKQPTVPSRPWTQAFNVKEVWTQKNKLRKPVVDYLVRLGYTDEAAREKFITGMYSKEEDGTVVNNIEKCLPRHHSLLSTAAMNYGAKFGIIDPEKVMAEIERLEQGGTPKVLKEKLRLAHKKDVKEFLMKSGWKPTLWKTRNIMTNPKTKQKLTSEETDVKLDKYLKEFVGSVYWPYIWRDLEYKREPDPESQSFRKKCIKQGRQLYSAPQYKDQRGDRCVHLKELTGDTSKLIIRWLSLQNRRNTIQSKTKDTGWLNHPRLKIDGRLPARSSGITPTYRQKHSCVVNVPKPAPDVVLGYKMRSLFIAPQGWWNIGCDACGIEARVAGHYAYPFDGGSYASSLLEGDVHTSNAKAYSQASGKDITRSAGKNLTYAIMYGAQAKKIGLMASVDPMIGQVLIDAFWDNNPGLKAAKEALITYWKSANKQYVMGIDGRKIITRSQHSIMNALFQSTGALIMDYAGCWASAVAEREGLQAERWGYIHDEYQWYHKKDEVDEIVVLGTPESALIDDKGKAVKRKNDPLKPEQEQDGKLWSVPKFADGNWTQHYSRVGEIIARGIEAAGRHFKMNLPFPGEYMVGAHWGDCH